jgi:anti-sigma regulatory factor (Ser/Thr protein kinase)/CheY-like chemotaxis protein
MSTATPVSLRPMAVRTALVIGTSSETDDLVMDALRSGPWSVQHVPDNRSALALAQRKTFDLILTSDKTSGREDVELLRKLRLLHPHTRLIILADESTPADVIFSMRERAFSYFSKPYTAESLTEMIQLAADGPCWDDGIEVVSATPEWIRVMVRCDFKTGDRLIQFLKEIAELPEEEKEAVALASREILLNAIEHGGKLDPNQYVEISYVRARHMVACRIADPGEGFTLDEIPHAAIANPEEDPVRHVALREEQGMRPGGYGVLLAQKLVDELIYNEKGNEALLIKYIHPSALDSQ